MIHTDSYCTSIVRNLSNYKNYWSFHDVGSHPTTPRSVQIQGTFWLEHESTGAGAKTWLKETPCWATLFAYNCRGHMGSPDSKQKEDISCTITNTAIDKQQESKLNIPENYSQSLNQSHACCARSPLSSIQFGWTLTHLTLSPSSPSADSLFQNSYSVCSSPV